MKTCEECMLLCIWRASEGKCNAPRKGKRIITFAHILKEVK